MIRGFLPEDLGVDENYWNGSMASMADDGSAAFASRLYDDPPGGVRTKRLYAYSVPQTGTGRIGERVEEMTSLDPPMAGDERRIVYRDGTRGGGVIKYRDHATGTMSLTNTTDWDWVGQSPGISGDGIAAAWVGNKDDVEGIYLRIIDPVTNHLGVIPVVTEDTPINFNDDGDPITFTKFSFTGTTFTNVEPRINVVHHDVDDDGVLVGDTFILSFIAKPEAASRENPSIYTTAPLLFSDQAGIWTVRVTIDTKLGGSSSVVATVDGVLPVIQMGDRIDGQPIIDLYLWDSLGTGLSAPDGTARIPEPGDHYLAFLADTSTSTYVVRANHLDDDGDGLLNHWEKPDGGIDMNRDGFIDLPLAEMGAQVNHKDLFLEIDWTGPRTTGLPRGYDWHNEPNPIVTNELVQLFADAPVPNPVGGDGITLHIDAGAGMDVTGFPFSRNMGTDPTLLEGGTVVTDGGRRPDSIYLGEPRDDLPSSFRALSMHEVKDRHFGTLNLRARELAFRYCVLADFQNFSLGARVQFTDGTVLSAPFEIASFVDHTTLTTTATLDLHGDAAAEVPEFVTGRGGTVLFISGAAARQIRPIVAQTDLMDGRLSFQLGDPSLPNKPSPGDRFVILSGNSGRAELFPYRDRSGSSADFRTLPGNDLLVTMGGFFGNREKAAGRRFPATSEQVWRTIAHEFGHSLALRHGGSDYCRYKGETYLSLMSYSHQLRVNAGGLLEKGDDGCETPTSNVIMSFPDPAGTGGYAFPVVSSYSDGSDPEGASHGYSDWASIMPSLWRTTFWLGNSYLKVDGDTVARDPHSDDLRARLDPDLDIAPPRIVLMTPAAGIVTALGADLTVQARVTDDVLVERVEFRFDLNGDGDVEDPMEVQEGTASPGDQYTVIYPSLSGPDEARILTVTAIDSSRNRVYYNPKIWVGSTGSSDSSGPSIGVFEPVPNLRVAPGGSFGVWCNVSDNSTVVRATVRFDLNGDGSIDPVTEEIPATYDFNGFSYTCEAALGPITGPVGDRIVEIVAEDCWRNTATQSRTIRVRDPDLLAPVLTLRSPVDGAVFGLGELIPVEVEVTDDELVSRVQARFDADGDGTEDLFNGTAGFGSPLYTITLASSVFFPPVGVKGPEGVRTVMVEAADESGNVTSMSFTIGLEDRLAPDLAVNLPFPGKAYAPGAGVVAEVHATDDGELAVLTATLDLNGDGDVTDGGETITPFPIGNDKYRANFGALSGPFAERVISFYAEDPTGKSFGVTRNIFVADGGVLLAPVASAPGVPGSHGRVFVQAVEGLLVDRIEIRFDSNGNGVIEVPGEVFAAGPGTGVDAFEGTYAITGGAPGSRLVTVEIFLSGGGSHLLSQLVEVGGGIATTGMLSQHKAYLPQSPNVFRHGRLGVSDPGEFASAGEHLFFTAAHQVSGREIWRTDGSAVGTILLRDIDLNKSAGDADLPLLGIGTGFRDRAVLGDLVIFTANDSPIAGFGPSIPESGTYIEPWVSDGTQDGTHVLKDIFPGREGSSRPSDFESFQGAIWFQARDPVSSPFSRMWKTDGTEGGTVPALPSLDIKAPAKLTTVGDSLFFLDGLANLWMTDGTDVGTVLLLQIDPGGRSQQVGEFVAGDGLLYFTAGIVGESGWELWRSDGTTGGTFLLRDIAPPTSGGEMPEIVGFLDGQLFFTQFSESDGRELWKTDGTIAGTDLVGDLRAGAEGSDPGPGVNFDGRLYFAADDGVVGRELWRTDGTAGGTELLADLWPGAIGGEPSDLTYYDGLLYFAARHPEHGRELWVTDGTTATTRLAVDLVPGSFMDDSLFPPAIIPHSGNPQHLSVHDGSLFFAAEDPHYRLELWTSDGTPTGTHRLRNIEKRNAPELFPWNGALYMEVADGSSGYELHRFDGIFFELLADHNAGLGDARAENVRAVGEKFVYSFLDRESFGASTYRLGLSDGTPGGTEEISTDFANLFEFTEEIDGLVYFRGSVFNDSELWRTDGTAAGTFRARDIYPGFSGSNPIYLTAIGNRIAFSADDLTHGRELWISDGTEAGTTMVKDFRPGTGAGTPRHLFEWNGALYFTASTGFDSRFLWKTDGTEAGTVNLSGTYAGTVSGNGGDVAFVEFDGLLYYAGVSGTEFELWRTDGTPGATVAVKDIASGGPEGPQRFAAAGTRFFFVARGASAGVELWGSDGTVDGTRLTRNIAGFNGSFEESSEPNRLIPIGNRVVFTAWNRNLGRELWVSDGTTDGTINLIDLSPGPLSGIYREFVTIGSEIYFTANDGIHGRELWKTDGTPGGTVLVEDLVPGAGSGNPTSLWFDGSELWYVADNGSDDLSLRCINPGADPYQLWLDQVSMLTGADRDLAADPNNNTRANLFEYGTGGDPDSSEPAPVLGMTAYSDGSSDLVFSFPRWRDWEPRGLVYALEFSTNLVDWTPVDLSAAGVRIVTGDFERVEFVIEASVVATDQTGFYRLGITVP